jgi:hypothetical protein
MMVYVLLTMNATMIDSVDIIYTQMYSLIRSSVMNFTQMIMDMDSGKR